MAQSIVPSQVTERKDMFPALSSGTEVTLLQAPSVGVTVKVFRNGKLQNEGATEDYTIAGDVITFSIPFGSSFGGTAVEEVQAIYR